jgi:hypothetical protein
VTDGLQQRRPVHRLLGWGAAGLLVVWLLLPWIVPLRARPFAAAGWRSGGPRFSGVGFSAPTGNLIRVEMVEDLLRNHLPPGTPQAKVTALLGEPGSGGSDGVVQEDFYPLVDMPDPLSALWLLRRFGTGSPTLRVRYRSGKLVTAELE